MMDFGENLIRTVANKVLATEVITYDGIEIDLSKPFKRISMVDAVKEYSGVEFTDEMTDDEAKAIADEHHIEYEKIHRKGDILNLFFDEYVEEKLEQPTFVTDYPIEISPLASKKPSNPNYTERFELFITKREMANAFSELNDPMDKEKDLSIKKNL